MEQSDQGGGGMQKTFAILSFLEYNGHVDRKRRYFLVLKNALLHKKWELSEIIRKLFFGWLVAICVEYALLQGEWKDLARIGGQGFMSLGRVLGITGGVTAVLAFLSLFWETSKWEKWGCFAAVALLMGLGLRASFSLPFLGACVLVLAVLLVYCLKGWKGEPELPSPVHKGGTVPKILLGVLAVGIFLFACVWTVSRVLALFSPSYDMGIFSQMFYSMKETGVPMTTLERDKLLSHFAVHVSPIYYLLLPFYAMVPHPATLQVLQALVLVSAVIPLWKLGTHHGLTPWQKLLLCAFMLLYPAFLGGTGFDIHENCFLTPLLLWLFYSLEKRRIGLISLFTLLTLCVKEDAAVYVAVIGLWFLVRTLLRKEKDKKQLLTALCLLGGALLWFFLATAYLRNRGDGVMEERYYNCMYNGNRSLWAVVRCMIVHPLKPFYECMDRQKLKYIVLTMAPFLGLPILTRRYERFLLLIPYILINLITDFGYQHDIFYQYSFGTMAFLLYLSLLNLKELPKEKLKTAFLTAGVAVAAVAFTLVVVPKAKKYPIDYLQNRAYYAQVRETLSRIPEEASVTANINYTVPLSQRKEIYDISHTSMENLLSSEYIVMDLRSAGFYDRFATEEEPDGRKALLALLEEQGYKETLYMDERLVIYQKQN